MNAAVLILLASGVGINFGWQPMPDGTPRYEYIVQMEPELAATLAEGHAIPISGEVPDEIRPIGRIRIVVGRDKLPRHTMTTRMKPFAEASRPQRYGSSVPPQSTVPPVQSSPIRYPQQQQSNSTAFGNLLRQAEQPVRADAQQLFGNPSNSQQPPANSAGNRPLGQLTRDRTGVPNQDAKALAQQGVEPFRKTVQQTGDQFRGAVQNMGDRTQEAIDQFDRPSLERSVVRNGQSQANGQAPAWGVHGTTITPGNTSLQRTTQPQGNLAATDTGQNASPFQRLDQPIGSRQVDEWQSTAEQGKNPDAWADYGNRRSDSNSGFAWPNGGRTASQSPQPIQQPTQQRQPTQWPQNRPDPSGVDSWANNRQQFSSSQKATPAPFLPKDRSSFAASVPANSVPSGTPVRQEITSDMLRRTPDAQLEPVAGEQTSFVSNDTSTGISPTVTRASDFGWDDKELGTKNEPAATLQSPEPTGVVPLILSWVLLSGSGAGNFYLFWSYLDVRRKYRGLVRGAARKFGGSQPELDD